MQNHLFLGSAWELTAGNTFYYQIRRKISEKPGSQAEPGNKNPITMLKSQIAWNIITKIISPPIKKLFLQCKKRTAF
jgi:hypothetical protein